MVIQRPVSRNGLQRVSFSVCGQYLSGGFCSVDADVVREMWKCLQDNRAAECSNGIARKAGGSVREVGDGKIVDTI
jgi:hypothetical protein